MVFANDSSHSLYKNTPMTSDLVWTFTFEQVPYFGVDLHFWTLLDDIWHADKYSEKIRSPKFELQKKTSSISCRFRTLLFPSRIEAQTRLHIYYSRAEKIFFVVSGSAEGSRKVPQIRAKSGKYQFGLKSVLGRFWEADFSKRSQKSDFGFDFQKIVWQHHFNILITINVTNF